MTVCFVTHYGDLYGANRSMLDLCDGLLKKGNNQISIIGPKEGDIIAACEKREIEYVKNKCVLEYYNKKYSFLRGVGKFILSLFNAVLLYCSMRKKGIDVVHSNSSAVFLGAYLSFLLRKPHVWHIREFGDEDYYMRYYFGDKYFYYLLKKSYPVGISKAIYEKRLSCVEDRRKIQIYNGVVWSKNLIRREISRFSENICFGVVGAITQSKNQFEALQAFNLFQVKYPDSKLIFVGGEYEKSYIEKLKNYIQTNNIKNVTFTGFVTNVNSYYNEIDILIMCSQHEALGRVTIEAMAQSVLVIGYDNAGTSEIIKNNYNGYLYQDSYHQLFEKMISVVNTDQKEIISNALVSVKENYTIEKYVDDMMSFYRKCIVAYHGIH